MYARYREAQRRHDGRRSQPSSRHVADDEQHAPLVECDDVVPVAADVDALDSGDVADAELHVRDIGKLVGEEIALQRLRERALVGVQLGVLRRELLGVMAAPHEPPDEQRRAEAERDSEQAENGREPLEQPAAELAARRHHEPEVRRPERHGLGRAAPVERQLARRNTGRDEIDRAFRVAEIYRVVEVGERGVPVDARATTPGQRGFGIRDVTRAGSRYRERVAEPAVGGTEKVVDGGLARRDRLGQELRDQPRRLPGELGGGANAARGVVGSSSSPARSMPTRSSDRSRRRGPSAPETLSCRHVSSPPTRRPPKAVSGSTRRSRPSRHLPLRAPAGVRVDLRCCFAASTHRRRECR